MKINILILALFILPPAYCNGQNWQWAKHIGSNYQFYNERSQVISDGTNIYLIGSYGGQLFLPGDTLSCNGNNDIFISKFDANGNNLWSKAIGGNFTQPTDYEDALGVFDSVTNSIYICGKIIGTVVFDTIVLNASQSSDIFIAKMDLNGNFIWAKKSSGTGIKGDPRVFVNPFGKIYIITQTIDSIYFGNFHIGPGGGIIQFDSLGNCLSAEIKFTSSIISNPNTVLLNFIGTDLIMYGGYRTASFQLDTASLTNQGDCDAFISRADSAGHLKWIKTFGKNGLEIIQSLGVDNSNNLYASGVFEDSINLGGLLVVNNGKDLLIAKFDENGSVIWANQAFSKNANVVSGSYILSDGDGNCYVTGIFSDSASFGTFNISTSNPYDMFITRYNSSGDCFGVRNFGSANGQGLAVDNNGSVYCNGAFENTVTIGSNTLTSFGYVDIYLAKIDAFTGIGEGEERKSNALNIYANPNAGKCNITIPEEFRHENKLTLRIYDNSGRLIQQKTIEINDGTIKLNLEAEAKGVYNVTLSNKTKSYFGKIVFE